MHPFASWVTSSVNGRVSPLYFRSTMRWDDMEDIWQASISQGILEGILFGLAFAVIFTAVVGLVSKGQSSTPQHRCWAASSEPFTPRSCL